MKKLNKNNKGFSLVELIVVVLIMAIIAVALAPQVLKWVNNSRISSDIATKDTIVSNFQTSMTNSAALQAVTAERNYYFTNNGMYSDAPSDGVSSTAVEIKTGGDALLLKFCEYSGITVTGSDAHIDAFKTKESGAYIHVKIEANTGKTTAEYKDKSNNELTVND